jgi:hypothetical protein
MTTEQTDLREAPLARGTPIPLIASILLGAILTAGMGLVAYAYTGVFTRYWADDFCIADSVQENGLIGAQAFWWENWTGRYSSVFLSDTATLLGSNAVPYFAGVLFAAGLLILWWLFVQISRLAFGRPFALASLLSAELILLVYLGAAANRTESFYWLAGSTNYTVPLLVFALLAGFVVWSVRVSDGQNRWLQRAGALVIAFVGAGFSETYMAWQTTLLLIALFASWLFARSRNQRQLSVLLLAAVSGSLIGGGVVYVAPGNEVREAQLAAPLPATEVLSSSVRRAAEITRSFLVAREVLLLGAAAFLFALLAPAAVRAESSDRRIAVPLAAAAAIAYLLVVVTVAPAYRFLHTAPPDRGWVTAEVSVAGAMVFWGFSLGRLLRESLPPHSLLESRKFFLGVSVATLVLSGVFALPATVGQFNDYERLSSYARAWDAREEEIQQARRDGSADLVVGQLRLPARLLDVTANPAVWSNICIASYYELNSIRTP